MLEDVLFLGNESCGRCNPVLLFHCDLPYNLWLELMRFNVKPTRQVYRWQFNLCFYIKKHKKRVLKTWQPCIPTTRKPKVCLEANFALGYKGAKDASFLKYSQKCFAIMLRKFIGLMPPCIIFHINIWPPCRHLQKLKFLPSECA